MIALAALSVVGIPFLTAMGLVAAGMVALAVLVALTLVPAFLGFAGSRFNRWPIPGLRGRQARLGTRPSFGSRWARAIIRKPVAFLVVAIVGAGVIALPALRLELGLPDDGTQPTNTTQRHAYDLLAEGFGPGFNGPLTIVVDGDSQAISRATTALARQLPERTTSRQSRPPSPTRRATPRSSRSSPAADRPHLRPRPWSPTSARSAATSSRRPGPTSWSPATRRSGSTSRRSSPARYRSSCSWSSGSRSSC